ncbi:hypothetical protein ScPMuIL_016969 [Solemya velum]
MAAGCTNIKDLRPGLKSINVMFIVLEIGKPTRTKDGHDVRTVKIADKSGSINISIWDEIGDLIQTGDICKLTKGYTAVWKGCLTLYTGKSGEIFKIGEFCMIFSELPNMSEFNQELVPKPEQQQSSGQRKSPTEEQNQGQPATAQGAGLSHQQQPRQPSQGMGPMAGNGPSYGSMQRGPRNPMVGSPRPPIHLMQSQGGTPAHQPPGGAPGGNRGRGMRR